MNRKTEKALHGSIRKWQGIVDGTHADEGPDNCPLCKLFLHLACEGCPVKGRTGKKYCWGSPYVKWDKYQYAEFCRMRDQHGYARTPKSKRLAMNELEFLKSLLPEPAKGVQQTT